MAKKTSGRRVSRSATTGRFVKSPAKAGSVRYRQVDRAVKTIASRRNGTANSRSADSSKTRT
jgi:hypothetical protein